MFREIVSASTSEAWIVLTPASIDKISKNACRHFAKKGHIHLPPRVAFTKPRARGFPLVDVWEAGKKSRSLSGIYCCRHDVKQDSVGDKFALTAWMISYSLSHEPFFIHVVVPNPNGRMESSHRTAWPGRRDAFHDAIRPGPW